MCFTDWISYLLLQNVCLSNYINHNRILGFYGCRNNRIYCSAWRKLRSILFKKKYFIKTTIPHNFFDLKQMFGLHLMSCRLKDANWILEKVQLCNLHLFEDCGKCRQLMWSRWLYPQKPVWESKLVDKKYGVLEQTFERVQIKVHSPHTHTSAEKTLKPLHLKLSSLQTHKECFSTLWRSKWSGLLKPTLSN